MKKILFSIFLGLLVSPSLWAASDPLNLNIKIYKMYVSTHGDCSSPTVVLDAEAAENSSTFPLGYSLQDVLMGPTFGSGPISDDTYQCVIFKMSDQIEFTPSVNDGACRAGLSLTTDICSSNGGADSTLVTNPVTGIETACASAEGVEDTVYLYLSTSSTNLGGGGSHVNSFQPPTSSSDNAHGIKLNAPLVVSGDVTATFVVDASGKVEGNSGQCGLQPPAFGFR